MSAGAAFRDSNSTEATVAQIAIKRFYSKTHANYWKARLEHRTYSRDGKTFEVAEWSVRIHFKSIRKSFDLKTANKEEAAAKARDIYLSLLAKGWFATVNELTPQPVPLAKSNSDSATVGEFLAEVERTANLKPKTFRYYGSCLRQIAAYVRGVKSDASRFDYRKGGVIQWREQVDATLLSAITPAAVADWKMARLNRIRVPNPSRRGGFDLSEWEACRDPLAYADSTLRRSELIFWPRISAARGRKRNSPPKPAWAARRWPPGEGRRPPPNPPTRRPLCPCPVCSRRPLRAPLTGLSFHRA